MAQVIWFNDFLPRTGGLAIGDRTTSRKRLTHVWFFYLSVPKNDHRSFLPLSALVVAALTYFPSARDCVDASSFPYVHSVESASVEIQHSKDVFVIPRVCYTKVFSQRIDSASGPLTSELPLPLIDCEHFCR